MGGDRRVHLNINGAVCTHHLRFSTPAGSSRFNKFAFINRQSGSYQCENRKTAGQVIRTSVVYGVHVSSLTYNAVGRSISRN